MSSAEALIEGLALTGIGMGVVFTFLMALVLLTGLMSKIVARFEPEPVSLDRGGPRGAGGLGEGQLLAIISAAIHRHRSRQDA